MLHGKGIMSLRHLPQQRSIFILCPGRLFNVIECSYWTNILYNKGLQASEETEVHRTSHIYVYSLAICPCLKAKSCLTGSSFF